MIAFIADYVERRFDLAYPIAKELEKIILHPLLQLYILVLHLNIME